MTASSPRDARAVPDGTLTYGLPHEQWYVERDATPEMWVQYGSDDLSVQASFTLEETRFQDSTSAVAVRMFSDSWVLWLHLPGLFTALAKREPKTLGDAAEVVEAFGGVDTTTRVHPGPQGPALQAVKEFQRVSSPENARVAAEALAAYAADLYEDGPF